MQRQHNIIFEYTFFMLIFNNIPFFKSALIALNSIEILNVDQHSGGLNESYLINEATPESAKFE